MTLEVSVSPGRANAVHSGGRIPILPSSPGSGNNWLWLAEPAAWDTALELGLGERRITSALREHFADVSYATIQPTLPFETARFDCVALPGIVERWLESSGDDQAAILFAECRRILRPGGCLYVGTGNFHGKARRSWLREIFGPGPLVVNQWLRDAGFGTVRSYCADPSLDRPFVIIPETRRALLARERILATSLGHNLRRTMAVRLGLNRALYGARMCLAYP